MALNLNALKNLPIAPLNPPKVEDIVVSTITTPSISKISLSKTSEDIGGTKNITPSEKISSTGPKISLMKLKKDSNVEIPVSPTIETNIIEKTEQEMSIAEIVSQAERKNIETPILIPMMESVIQEERVSISTIEESIDLSPATSTTINEQGIGESLSIFSNDESKNITPIKENIENETPKEFFPNFHISNEMDIDADLFNIENNIPVSSENSTSIIYQQPTNIIENIPVTQEIIEIEVPVIETKSKEIEDTVEISTTDNINTSETVPTKEVVSEKTIPENISDTPVITSEYVAEVKTELSEQRRAGFRFFVQKNTKIMA
jgi:hypothetical protein